MLFILSYHSLKTFKFINTSPLHGHAFALKMDVIERASLGLYKNIMCLSIKFPNMVKLAKLLFYNKVMDRIANYDMQQMLIEKYSFSYNLLYLNYNEHHYLKNIIACPFL